MLAITVLMLWDWDRVWRVLEGFASNRTIAAIATKDFSLGHLGLTIHRTNFISFSDPQVTFLESMKASNNIPSILYAYSAVPGIVRKRYSDNAACSS